MVTRPNVFSQEQFQESLRRQGCPESFIQPITSDFRLLVPLAIRGLGAEGIIELLERTREDLSLGEQTWAWQSAAKYSEGWALEQIAEYKSQKQKKVN